MIKKHNNLKKIFNSDTKKDHNFNLRNTIKKIISATNIIAIAIAIFSIFLLLFQIKIANEKHFLIVHFKFILFMLAIFYCVSILWQIKNIERKKLIQYTIQSVLLIIISILIKDEFKYEKGYMFGFIIAIITYIWILLSNWSSLSTSTLSPSQLISFSFIFAIVSGGLALYLPISTIDNTQISFVDAIFISTSAVCVTGLSMFDINTTFSIFGLVIILILIQIGGIGIMTFSVLFMSIFSERVSVNDRVRNYGVFDLDKQYKPIQIVKVIIIATFIIELIGAIILFTQINANTIQERVALSIFHSISAFCNAGFSTYSNSLHGVVNNYTFIMTISALIVLGGIGFTVIFHLLIMFTRKIKIELSKNTHRKIRMTTQTRVVLIMTVSLIMIGTVFIFLNEYNNSFKDYSLDKKIVVSIFNSVTPRTAGFEVVPISDFKESSQWFIIFLMFIGANPGSTGGGIKTTTLFLLISSLYIVIKNKPYMIMHGRRIPTFLINKAIAVTMIAFLIATLSSFIISVVEPDIPLMSIIYECVSAISTVGLSFGITAELSDISKCVIILLMYIGRIGHLTILMSIGDSEKRHLFDIPTEDIMVG